MNLGILILVFFGAVFSVFLVKSMGNPEEEEYCPYKDPELRKKHGVPIRRADTNSPEYSYFKKEARRVAHEMYQNRKKDFIQSQKINGYLITVKVVLIGLLIILIIYKIVKNYYGL